MDRSKAIFCQETESNCFKPECSVRYCAEKRGNGAKLEAVEVDWLNKHQGAPGWVERMLKALGLG